MKKAGAALLLWIVVAWLGLPADALSVQQQGQKPGGQKTREISEVSLRNLFHDFVCDRLGKGPSDAILSRFKVSGNRPVPEGRLGYQVFQKSKGTPKGHVRLTVMVSVDGVTRSEVTLSGWIDAFGPVVCTARPMQKGEQIAAEDLYLARKNLSRLPENVMTDMRKAVGMVLKNNLDANTSVKEWMLKSNPTVDKGERITILARLGGLRVSVPGTTMEKGFAGEIIRVENAMSRKKIFARIIDANTVAVEF